jgi:hypothetical protein
MNPPTEQLIRDYLNRVSVAARGRLSANDRRALLARTREFIEQNTRAVGRIQTADVIKLLSELGDPSSLVSAERERLAAVGTETGADASADSSLAARARRLRAAPANVASLLRASAAVVAPGDAPIVPEAAEDNPLTGDFEEIVRVRRPISSRWRPGEIVIPRQPGPRRPGLRRRPGAGLPPADGRPQPPAPGEPAAKPPADSAPQGRPEWPSVTARRTAAESRRGPSSGAPPTPQEPGTQEAPDTTRPSRPAINGPTTSAPATNMPAASESATSSPPAPAPDTDRDRPAAGDTAPSAPGADWTTLSATEADWAGPAAAGGNWTAPAAGSDRAASATGPSSPSLTNGTSAGPGPAPTAVPGDRIPPPADAGDSRPDGGRPPASAAAGPGPVAGPDSGPGSAAASAAATTEPGSASPAGAEAAFPADEDDPRPVNGNTLVGPPPAGAGPGPAVPPRDARVTWASGVRSRAMRIGPVRTASARLSGSRSGGPRDGQSGPAAGAEPDGPPRPGGEFLATAGGAAGRTAQVVVRWVRRHPLEAVAVVLLGLGGLIYPPVWLMGALVAVFSKAWSISDKWIGLALPVFLVIVGIVVEVSLAGNQKDWTTYVRDAWVFAGHLSRILALLGAIYLAWRVERGPRSPGVPPWQKARRFG